MQFIAIKCNTMSYYILQRSATPSNKIQYNTKDLMRYININMHININKYLMKTPRNA